MKVDGVALILEEPLGDVTGCLDGAVVGCVRCDPEDEVDGRLRVGVEVEGGAGVRQRQVYDCLGEGCDLAIDGYSV